MANVATKAYLRVPNKKGLCTINVWYIYGHANFSVPVGHSVLPEHFDKETGQVLKSQEGFRNINLAITQVSTQLLTIADKFDEPTVEKVKAEYQRLKNKDDNGGWDENYVKELVIEEIFNPQTKVPIGGEHRRADKNEKGAYLHQPESANRAKRGEKQEEPYWAVDTYDTIYDSTKPTKKKKEEVIKDFKYYLKQFVESRQASDKASGKQYKSWAKQLLEFSAATKTELNFNMMKQEFYLKYQKYCLTVLNHSDNHFGVRIKKLKTFLRWIENEMEINVSKQFKTFKSTTEKKDVVWLRPWEIDMLWSFEVKPEMRKYIDICVFGCLTGLRYIDIHKPSFKIVNGQSLEGKPEKTYFKTKKIYQVPLSLDPRILQILQKYDFNLELVSDVKFNKYIKLILKDMYEKNREEILKDEVKSRQLEKIEIIKYKAGKAQKPQYFDKWELYTSHCNRRSFVCYNHARNFSLPEILQMLGSSSLVELQRYLDIDQHGLFEKAAKLNQG